jgi:acyl-CoA synthetase (AMP-forming)/AMP-acid ligase II
MVIYELWSGDSDKIALRDPVRDISISYRELRQAVEAGAERLAGAGVGPGDRVVVTAWTGIEATVGFLAILGAGATALPVSAALTTAELERHARDLRPGYALVHDADGARSAYEAMGVRVAGIDLARPAATGTAATGTAEGGALPHSRPQPREDAIALILQTSGTTGGPKSVPLTQGNLAASTATIAAGYQLGPGDTAFCMMPLFHVHGLIGIALTTLASGGTVVMPSRVPMNAFWSLMAENEITWVSAVPTMLARIPAGRQREHRLRFIRSASSPLPPTLAARLEQDTGVPVVEAYGMTEATHQLASNPLPPGVRVPGSVGVATGTEISIVDPEWAHLPSGETGEVVVRGASITTGYLDNPEANAASFRDGWFRTGDLGQLSDAGYVRLVGRLKEMINRGGEKISPREVDEALLTHPGVVEAATYGVPDEKYGEAVQAVVVVREGVESKALIEHCRGQLAPFKIPRVIHIVDSIPKGPTGKIQRNLLSKALDGR